MNDLVERLRQHADALFHALDTTALLKEAADEIETLRALAGAVSHDQIDFKAIKRTVKRRIAQDIFNEAADADNG